MVLGIGVDLVAVPRIASFLERRGRRGLERIYGPGELAYCLDLAQPAPSLAARFAAKEAFFKALGTGYGAGGRWAEVEVIRSPAGRPELRLHGRAAEQARRHGVRRTHLSLSHTADVGIAFVILEG
jgi:holo-[acyl-carrier protein] synthase